MMSRVHYIPEVIEQYVDDIPFLYQFRQSASVAPDYNAQELLELDERLAANIEALLMIGGDAWDLCEDALTTDSAGDVFTLAVVAIELEKIEKIEWLVGEVAEDSGLLVAVTDAFAYFSFEKVKLLLAEMYKSEIPVMQYVVVASFRLHRQVSPGLIRGVLSGDNYMARAEAVKSVGVLCITPLLSLVTPLFDDDDENVAFMSCWTGSRFGNADALNKLESFVVHPRYGDFALQYVVMQNDTKKITEILQGMYSDEATKRQSIRAMGYFGMAGVIDSLVSTMKLPEFARVSGESFSLITGINLPANGLDLAHVDDAPDSSPTESADDENIEMDPDEGLPWPDPEKISLWWAQNRSDFLADKRYICGEILSADSICRVLSSGSQRQRVFAANIQALLNRKSPLLDVTALGVCRTRHGFGV